MSVLIKIFPCMWYSFEYFIPQTLMCLVLTWGELFWRQQTNKQKKRHDGRNFTATHLINILQFIVYYLFANDPKAQGHGGLLEVSPMLSRGERQGDTLDSWPVYHEATLSKTAIHFNSIML